jgi:Rrf2 family protein
MTSRLSFRAVWERRKQNEKKVDTGTAGVVIYIRPKGSDIEMLKLSKRADYGLIAVRHLAGQPSSVACSANEIARAYGIPAELLAKILQKLARNGLLISQHGTNGGYVLAKPPSQLTALEVIRAIEGPLLITSCVTERRECGQMLKCTVREPLRHVNDALLKALGAVTISHLGAEQSGLVQIGGSPQ